jgi:Cof subfamily protein (haloacid dehalogenase superfamily)
MLKSGQPANPPYRLIAIDLDGTLLNSRDHAVSAANSTQVRRLLDLGVFVVLASGRRYHTIVEFARHMEIPPSTPLIAYNGALLRTVAGDTLFHQPMPTDYAKALVHFCAAHDYHLNYYLDDVWYIREETQWSRLYRERTGSVPKITHDLTLFDGHRPTKLLLIDTPAVTDRLLGHFKNQFGDALYMTKTDREYLEFMHAGVSKGVALAKAAQGLGVPQEATIAVGDSFNDIPMLEWAGRGIAMRNAPEALQAVADQIAPPADEDGVAAVLRDLFP